MTTAMRSDRIAACILVAALLAAPAAAPADTVPAAWEPHQLEFHYSGFTSDYTCDGIRSKLKLLLRAVGARDDVRIEGCAGFFNEVQPFHRLKLAFSVPVPAPGGGSPGENFAAEWREVRIHRGEPRDVDWGDCELVEQFARQVLPAFNPQELDEDAGCVPHRHSLGRPRLRMTLLMPVAEAAELPE
jgi:hypothetical protein